MNLKSIKSKFTATPKSRPNYDIVGDTFYSIIFLMKWFGIFPVSILYPRRIYGPSPFWAKLYSASSFLFVSTWVLIYTLNRGFNVTWPAKLWEPLRPQDILKTTFGGRQPPTFFTWVSLAIQIMIPTATLVYGHLGFIDARGFCVFVNQWAIYIQRLEKHFSRYAYSSNFADLRKYRNAYLLAYLPAFLLSVFIIPFLTNTKVLQISEGPLSVWTIFFTFTFVQVMITIRVITAIKDFLSFQVLQLAYRELRLGVQAEYAILQENVTRAHVRKWLKLVIFIRNQRSLLESHITYQNIWMLVEIFFAALLVLTASIVVLINDIQEYIGWVTTYVFISGALIVFRFFRAHLAEGISEQEELLAEAVIAMTNCRYCDARLEMKSFCDLIFHDPIKITLGSVFVLNKRLSLAFCGHLATSLVILLQFVNH